MSDLESHIDLVRKAQQGGKDATGRLAEVASVRLREYVLRLTLDNDLTEDIVQESILEMLRVFDKLKNAERFWSWLYGIAYNKVRTHRRGRSRQKAALLSVAQGDIAGDGKREAFAETIGGELKHIVLKAMAELKPQQRDVLTMRCYDQMPYARIAELMGCSKFAAQALFYRAKKSLAKGLSRHGLGKGYLLAALVLFGKLTASSEAAANITVTAATLKIGTAASLAAIATSKTAIVTMTAAAIVTAGSVVIEPGAVESNDRQINPDANSSLAIQPQPAKNATADESWYYYPAGSPGPVMMRLSESYGRIDDSRFRILQNQHGNYRYENNTVCIENFRSYNPDLSVRRLPTDDKPLTAFISQIEGATGNMEYVSATGRQLLVICKRDSALNDKVWRVDRRSNVLDEAFFQSDWPEGTRIVDNRDQMHRRGWTWFRVSGQISGEQITGTGRIPFVYEMTKIHYPWADIKIGKTLRIIDSEQGVYLYDAAGKTIETYAAGSFFDSLGTPWMGLHTIDTIRRAAASRKVAFETKRIGQNKVQIALTAQKASLIYEIDLERDVVETIKVLGAGGAESDAIAIIRFDYFEEIPPADTEFTPPTQKTSTAPTRGRLGPIWPLSLLEGNQ